MQIKNKVVFIDMHKFGDQCARGVKATIVWFCIFMLGSIFGATRAYFQAVDMIEERVVRDVNYLLLEQRAGVFFRVEDSTLKITVQAKGRKRPSDAMNIKLVKGDYSIRP